ncbi:component of the polarisome [Blyttiomyces sp. JEL0837]|nr:component of the polarisome [Blyttiomyces sp. JEL0837]
MDDAQVYQRYEALRQYLDSYLQSQKASASQHMASAREKMTRLSKQQFFDLATDVYDEMNRRQTGSKDLPFLPVRDDLHPKRNQARQKLATLPTSRFKDLARDIFYDIERRYPNVVTEFDAKFGVGPANDNINSSNDQYLGARGPMPPQGSKSPQDVNFSSLDNLMADLGNLMTPNRPNGEVGLAPESVDKLRNEYESRIEALQSRIAQYEQDMRNMETQKVMKLEEELRTEIQINKELEAKLSMLQQDYDKLKEDYDGLQDDYNNQQQIANDIRAEATNLLDEIKNLSRKNDELLAERDRYYNNGNPSNDRGAPPGKPNLSLEDNGIIDRARVTAYQTAVDDLLAATRSDSPTNILVAMKSIVIACKNITEDTEAFENNYDGLTYEDKERLDDVKARLSGSLQNLMTVAKTHATNFNTAPVSLLENAASNLTGTIVELVRLLKLKQNQGYNNNQGGGNNGGSGWGGEEGENYEIDELKIFLEKKTDLIVQAIQSLLLAMKQNSSDGAEFNDTVRNITGIVSNLVKVSSRTLSKPSASSIRQRGEAIIQDLGAANVKLEDLGIAMMNSPQSKTLKPKLASSSYEIAKQTAII